MKLIKTLMIAVVAFVATSAHAQTVDEIISKHVEAIGGKDKLNQVKSVYSESAMEVMGNAVPQKEYLLNGKGIRTEAEFNGSNIVNCLNDKGGWSINPMTGGDGPQAMPEAMYKAGKSQIYLNGGLVDYAAKGYKAELAGKEDGSFKIKLSGDGSETYYYIDPATYYLTKSVIKSEMMGQTVDVTTTYSDFKKTDFGVVLPFAKNIDMGMFQLAQKISKVEVNKEIDATMFEMPK